MCGNESLLRDKASERSDPSVLEILRGVRAETGRRRFRDFVEMAWPYAETRPFIPNWHIDAIADHLQAVTEGHIRRLLITVPPGHAKSLLVSVFWPAWQWLVNPTLRGIFTSYDADLAMRDSVRCRGVLASDWFQGTFRPKWKFARDQNVKRWFANDAKGFRMALSVGSKCTGFRGDYFVVDDPLNAKKQHSDAALNEVIFWWDQVMSSRLNDLAKGAIVIIMQRLSERDLAAHVLEQGGYEHLNLPTEFERERRATTSLRNAKTRETWCDPRQQDGELLFVPLFPAAVIADAKKILGPQGYAAQHQQRPAPAEGIIFKRQWWRFWKPKGAELPAIFFRNAEGDNIEASVIQLPDTVDEQIQSWDCSFKDLKTSDFVAGHLWGRLGADAFLLDRVHGRMDIVATRAAVQAMSAKWPGALAKFVEEAANGFAVIQLLQHKLPGLLAVKPLGGKVARARAVTPMIASGNVYLPHPAFAPWVNGFIEECSSFPNGRNDDDVDAMSQALTRLSMGVLVEVPTEPEDDEGPVEFPG
jgi:predicted phage terminase large subunit-like protein